MTENKLSTQVAVTTTSYESAKRQIIVALDVSTPSEALALVDELIEHVGMFKVGLELFTSAGPSIIDELVTRGCQVFLDTKFMDIPATVRGASRAAARLGVCMFNVHCLGGSAMMTAAVDGVAEVSQQQSQPRPMVIGVTILTSIDQRILNEDLNISSTMQEEVCHLALSASNAGLDGVIASPQEVLLLRNILPTRMKIITPGVRPRWAQSDDQMRVATPAEAIKAGANFVVVGRPITRPPKRIGSPSEAARQIAEEIASVPI